MKRRDFVKLSSVASVTLLTMPYAFANTKEKLKSSVKIGIIADLHHDVMHDGEKRLDVFLEAMKLSKPDAIIQMGDFAVPSEKNKPLINKFNSAHKNSLHVIGNHDMDYGYSIENCVDVWQMPSRYYTQHLNGVTLIVLDANEKKPDYKSGYSSYIGDEQLKWLVNELEKATEPVIIFSHQPLAGVIAIDNHAEVQKILSKYKNKIIICLNGHTHNDSILTINGITYMHINSASYKWVGSAYKHYSYAKDIHEKNKGIAITCPYESCVYAVFTIDPVKGNISIEGVQSDWVGDSPAALGINYDDVLIGVDVVPAIKNRILESLLNN